MNKLKFLLLSALIYSCSAVRVSPISSRHETLMYPQLSSLTTKEIGETLVSSADAYYYDAIEVLEDYKMTLYKYNGGIKKGIYTFKGSLQNYNLYYPADNGLGVAISTKGEPNKGFNITGTGGIKFVVVKQNISYRSTTFQDIAKSNFKQEFIYSGKSGNILKFSYREFSNDMARPAFTQELQYDLNESSIIGFKGLRVEILKATNTNLEYKVLNHFTS